MSVPSEQHNVAARMAVWSSRHRRKAFWGWLAFVVVVFALGQRGRPDTRRLLTRSHGPRTARCARCRPGAKGSFPAHLQEMAGDTQGCAGRVPGRRPPRHEHPEQR